MNNGMARVRDRWPSSVLGKLRLGGLGFGQLKLALLNEVLGRSLWAPTVFGSQAPDSGNREILATFGSPTQKKLYLQPLLDGEIHSCYSMTELHAGADPTLFRTRAVQDSDEWIITGDAAGSPSTSSGFKSARAV